MSHSFKETISTVTLAMRTSKIPRVTVHRLSDTMKE